MELVLAAILCLVLNGQPCLSISCLDEDGNPVDWFVGYKFPGSFNYAYLLPGSDGWQKSENEINENGMLKNTYELMYSLRDTADSVYGTYNDQISKVEVPNAEFFGHLKGAFAFHVPSTGFWIIHSIPKLSAEMHQYAYPSSGKVYGQHFMCVTLDGTELEKVASQLAISQPQFMDTFISPKIGKAHPKLKALLRNEKVTEESTGTQSFSTPDGSLQMLHFSKAITFDDDLYAALVAPRLGHGLNVETWQHGKNLPSYCETDELRVYNIESLRFDGLDVEFATSKDHAKWATTIPKSNMKNSGQMWACLGDINRQPSQFKRGGGTMCISNSVIWKAFNDLVDTREECP